MQLSFLNQWFTNDVMKALTWTFVHSLWQGLVAALLAAVIISTTKKSTAKLRYNLLGAVLILFILTAFITFLNSLAEQEQLASSSLQTAAAIPGSSNIDSSNSSPVSESFLTTLSNWFNNNTGSVLLAWVLFFSLNCLKLFIGLAAVNRLRTYKTHPVTAAWKLQFEQLQKSLGIRQSVTLLQSELVKVPVALGYLKPVILLPLGLLANIPAEQVETILLHELAHIRRKDYLVNCIQHFVEAIFFFNPGVRWISSLLRQEREACCDDIVVANSGQKSNYLNALVAFQEYSLSPAPYTMAISSKRHYLLNRVKRLLTNENKGINIFEKAILLIGIIFFSAFTLITKEKGTKEVVIQQAYRPVSPIITVKPALPPVKKQKRLTRRLPKTDTVPAKKDTAKITRLVKIDPSLSDKIQSENTVTNVDKALQDIITIKEKIGVKKESIGKKKALLLKPEEKGKDEIQKEIEKERKEIDVQRAELDRKRANYEELKKRFENKKESAREKEHDKKADKKPDHKDKNIFPTNKKTLTKDIKYTPYPKDVKYPTDTKDINYSTDTKDIKYTPYPKDVRYSTPETKALEYKLTPLKELNYDRQLKLEPKIKIGASSKTIEQKAPVKPATPKTKTQPSAPVKI